MKKIILFFVMCVVGLVAEEPVVAPPASVAPVGVAPVIAPKSFFDTHKKLQKEYVDVLLLLDTAKALNIVPRLKRLLEPLTKASLFNKNLLQQKIDVCVRIVKKDVAIAAQAKKQTLRFLGNVRHALRSWLGRHWKKLAAAWFVLNLGLLTYFIRYLGSLHPQDRYEQTTVRFVRAIFKFRKWRVSGGGCDFSGNYIPPYALSKQPVSQKRAEDLACAAGKRVSLGWWGPKKKTAVEYLSSVKQMRRNFALNESAKLRKFVITPDQEGDDFERAAFAISQIDVLSPEKFLRRKAKAEPFLRERIEKLILGPFVDASDRPEELLRRTEKLGEKIKSQLERYGKAEYLKRPGGFNLDAAFIFEFTPFGPSPFDRGGDDEYGAYCFVPGEGYHRSWRGCGCPPDTRGGYSDLCSRPIIIKIANPYAWCKTHEAQRLIGAGGENQSIRRNVERVWVADEINKDTSTNIRAPHKVLALTHGAAGRLIDDRTAVVIAEKISFATNDDEKTLSFFSGWYQSERREALCKKLEDKGVNRDKIREILEGMRGDLADQKHLNSIEGSLKQAGLSSKNCGEIMADIRGWLDRDLDRLIEICDRFGLTDLHDDNVKKADGGTYLIDTEKVGAKSQKLKSAQKYQVFAEPFYSRPIAQRLRARLKARGISV